MLRSVPFNPMHSTVMRIKLSRKKSIPLEKKKKKRKFQKPKDVEFSTSMSASRSVSIKSLLSPPEGNIRWFVRFTAQEMLGPIKCSTA